MLAPRRFALASLAFLTFAAGLATAETRFGRPIVKLANPKDFEFVSLGDGRFPMLRKNETSVACIAYREAQRYFIEVAVMNQSSGPIELKKDFVQFKSNFEIQPLDTLAAAAEIQSSPASSVPVQGISTSRSSTIQAGSSITANEERKGSSQMMLEAMVQNAQVQTSQLVAHLTRFAHEKQSLTLEPKATRFFIFVFEQAERKKAPFEISVNADAATWSFFYKD